MAGTLVVPNDEGRGGGFMSVDLTGALLFAGGEVGAVANPEGKTLKIIRAYLHVITASTGVATLSIGIGATKSTSGTDIANALTINGVTANTVYLLLPGGDAAKDDLIAAPANWTSGLFVTATGSASTVGFTGRLFLEYIRLE